MSRRDGERAGRPATDRARAAAASKREAAAPAILAPAVGPGVDVSLHLDRMMLERYAPPGVLITDRMEILQFRGQTGAYLQPAPGDAAQSNLIDMLRPGLLAPLRAAITQAKKEMATVRSPAEIREAGASRRCEVVVVPCTEMPEMRQPLFLVLFEEALLPATVNGPKGQRRLPKLEHELTATKEFLQTVLEQHRKATSELGCANEELLSGNEALHSLNQKLETAKEDLQSSHEKLTTVSDELHCRTQEVTLVNGDLLNLLSTVDIPILILDRECRIRRFTPKARSILNLVSSDVGRPFSEIQANVFLTELQAQVSHVLDSVEMTESEVQDQEGHWYRLHVRRYRTSEGRIDGAILSLVDIDALKHHLALAEDAKVQAERANGAKDEFLATLSHELRTPLTTMLLQAQRIRRGHLDAENLERAAKAIERGTEMQAQLIDHLLDVSRIVGDKMEMALQSFDLVGVVKASLEDLAPLAASKQVVLTVALDESLGSMWGSPTRLQQVVSNLLVNAIKFTPAEGEVKVVLEGCDGRARLQVSDNGRGIDPAFLPHIFRRFSQEDHSVTRTHGGLGLGLAITHHLVGLHGGSISAESLGPGKGATFVVSLPLERSPRAHAEEAARRQAPRLVSLPPQSDLRRLVKLRVLVVDDDLGAREAVAEMLEGTGAEVRVAESAAAGLALFEDFRPGVVLCDIAMPGEDGYSFIRRMRALGCGRGGATPALALTALASEDDRLRAISAGFQMHVAKPVDSNRLTQAVVDLSVWPTV